MADKGAVVITGASTGIGAACALHLDKLGYRVFAGIRKAADGESLRQRASARLVPVRLDISDEAEVGQAARNVIEALGGEGLAGLVNNAGIVVGGMLEFLPLEALRRQLEVNVVGQIAVTQAFLPSLRKARGRIVNMGSVSGLISGPFTGAYSASKFALEALTDSLRLELRPWKIHVSIVEPGFIQTPIVSKSLAAAEALRAQLPEEALQLYGASLRAVREGTERAAAQAASTEVVVKAVVHALAARRPRTRYVVGQHSGFRISLTRALLPDRWRDALIARYMGLK
ncbi:MAG: SDR family oxidoreductase [Terriglobia bacterium]|jgi:NAD(P)-dependent dehydrogenase (short-subunit alcohol dehydrogenase family)